MILLRIRWTGMVEIKRRDFIDVVPIMPCQDSSWIMGSRIYGEGRTQTRQSLPRYNRSSGTRSRIDRIYTDIEIASNTKINYIMVPFTDHYNAISLDRLLSKTKIGKDQWYFNIPLLCKFEVSSTKKKLLIFY